MPRSLRHDRAHDYPFLIRRWRSIAAQAGLVLQKYGEAGGCELFYLRSRRVQPGVPAMYFSAGIHGDEPAATEGLLVWAQENPPLLKQSNALIFPCLNPWGLISNCRLDPEGRDLNRSFRNESIPQIVRQMALFTDQAFDLTLMLHEDYDARGVYLYEVAAGKPHWGELLIKAASRHIAPDLRRRIEGRSSRGGVLRPVVDPDLMPDWPEAFVLYFQRSNRVFTVETPSEFHLDDRVAAHVAMIGKAVSLCRKEFSLRSRLPRP